MPSVYELLTSPISGVVFAIYFGLMALEALFPGRPLPRVRLWRLRGLAAFAVYFLLSSYLPLWWDGALAQYRLIDLTAWHPGAAFVAGFVVYELLGYAYHRSMHRFTPLWRTLHQMHHSSERLDVASAFWFSPFDMIGWTFVTSAALVLVVGLAPEPATWVILTVTFLSVFQHANLHTPRWLGYLVQRPESHSHHHGRGVHANNYADLPLIDLVFGTFHNPRDFAWQTGYYDGASARVPEMLIGRDVSRPREAPVMAPELAARRIG